ncbi:MAG: hypothetical protein HY067_01405 [Betaproteobacteria bacterium]|nr:hypothetical protein [Betaproteobacteria bacterium]
MPPAVVVAPEIDGEPYFWKDGEDVLLDETFIHYALKYAILGGLFYWIFLT